MNSSAKKRTHQYWKMLKSLQELCDLRTGIQFMYIKNVNVFLCEIHVCAVPHPPCGCKWETGFTCFRKYELLLSFLDSVHFGLAVIYIRLECTLLANATWAAMVIMCTSVLILLIGNSDQFPTNHDTPFLIHVF